MKLVRWQWIVLGVAIVSPVVLVLAVDTGLVVDGSTGKPLPGVHVTARWDANASVGVSGRQVCLKVEGAQTDEQGRFSLGSWSGSMNPLMSGRQRTLLFYKKGYLDPERAPRGEPDNRLVVMMPDTREAADRLKYLAARAGGLECGSESEQRTALLPRYRAMQQEAVELARTPEGLGAVNTLLFVIDTLEVGWHEAHEKAERRRREWGLQ